jgi:broad specificity phosphatase PhoE
MVGIRSFPHSPLKWRGFATLRARYLRAEEPQIARPRHRMLGSLRRIVGARKPLRAIREQIAEFKLAEAREREFEAMVDAFFAQPQTSVRGWEPAADGQARIVRAVELVISQASDDGPVSIIGHGGTGTLLYCHLAGVLISRRHEQPATNGGNWFAFDGVSKKLVHVGWRSIDMPTPEDFSSIRRSSDIFGHSSLEKAAAMANQCLDAHDGGPRSPASERSPRDGPVRAVIGLT